MESEADDVAMHPTKSIVGSSDSVTYSNLKYRVTGRTVNLDYQLSQSVSVW